MERVRGRGDNRGLKLSWLCPLKKTGPREGVRERQRETQSGFRL